MNEPSGADPKAGGSFTTAAARAWRQVEHMTRIDRLGRKGKRRLGIGGGILLALVLFLTFVPSIALRYGLAEGLKSLGMAEVTIRNAEVGLFGGRMEVTSLDARPPQGPTGGWEDFQLRFGWRPLFSKRLLVERLALAGPHIEVERKPDGSFVISGLPVPLATAPPPEGSEDDKSTPWGVGIEELLLTKGKLVYREGEVEIVFDLERLQLTQLRSWDATTPAKLDLQATLNGALFAVTGDLLLFGADKQNVNLNLNINELDLGRLAPLLKLDMIRDAGGLLIAKALVDADILQDGRFRTRIDGDIGLDKFKLTMPDANASYDKLLLAGKIDVTQETLDLDATLTIDAIKGRQGEIEGELDQIKIDLKPMNFALKPAGSTLDWQGGIDLSGVAAKLPDIAARLGRLGWSGKIDGVLGDEPVLNASGSIAVDSAETTVPGIEAKLGQLRVGLEPMRVSAPKDQGLRIGGKAKLELTAIDARLPDLSVKDDAMEWAGDLDVGLRDGTRVESSGALKVSGLAVERPDIKVELGMFELRHQPVTVQLAADGAVNLAWVGETALAGLKAALSGIAATQGRAGFGGRVEIALPAGGAPTGRIAGELQTSGTRAELADLGLWVEQRAARIATEVELVEPKDGQLAPARIGARIELDGLGAGSLKEAVDLARLEKFLVDGFRIEPGGAVNVGRLALTDLKGLQRTGNGNYPWRLELGGLNVLNAARQANGELAIDRVALDRALVRVVRAGAGIVGLGDIPGARAEGAPAAKPATGDTAPKGAGQKAPKPEGTPAKAAPAGPRVALREFALVGENRVVFEDRTFKAPLRVEAKPIALKVNDIDTGGGKPMKIEFSVGFGEYGALKLSGNASPFDEKLNMAMKAEIKEFDLPPFSPYVSDAVGVNFLTGQLNADADVKVVNEAIAGEVKAILANLFLDEREGQDNVFAKESGLPVGTALGLLRDDAGNIELAVPLSGNINDPQFDLSSVISKAIGSAIRSAAATTLKVIFPPALLISAVSGAANAAPGIKPLEFAPASIEIAPAQEQEIALLAELMQKRPTLRMNLCGSGTRKDWEALLASDVTRAKEEAEKQAAARPPVPKDAAERLAAPPRPAPAQAAAAAAPPPPPEPDVEKLEELARMRSGKVKQSLITKHKIEAGRLFECRPSVRLAPDATPRVEIRL